MASILQQLLNGVILGSVYALLALGYTMVYGIIKLINFAHGDVYMLGAYFGYFFIKIWHLNFFVALILSMIVSAGVGVLIELVAYRPLRHSPRIAVLISALGVSFLLENGMSYAFGSDKRAFPQAIATVQYHVGQLQISNIQLLIIGTAVVLMLALTLIFQKTKMGRAMRAVSADQEAAVLMGINVNRTILIIVVLGGIGSMSGTVVTAVILGMLDVVLQNFGPLRMVIYAVVLIVVMIFRPKGLLGTAELSLKALLFDTGGEHDNHSKNA